MSRVYRRITIRGAFPADYNLKGLIENYRFFTINKGALDVQIEQEVVIEESEIDDIVQDHLDEMMKDLRKIIGQRHEEFGDNYILDTFPQQVIGNLKVLMRRYVEAELNALDTNK